MKSSITLNRRWVNACIFAFFLVFSGFAYSVTGTFPSPLLPGYPGSAMFPRLVLIVMAVISFFGLVRLLLSHNPSAPKETITLPFFQFLGVVSLLLGFAALLGLFGMEVAVFGLIGGCIWFRTRKILISAGAGVASVLVVYFLFVQALSVHLPLLILPRYLMGY
jgi:hypothetical protein